jgi:hypothetical protein
MPGRIDPVHKHMSLQEAGLSTATGWDDEITFNTQVTRTLRYAATVVLISCTENFAMG